MSQALYRKYRSKKLSEIVGQEHITKTLENALKQGKISHAYLFTGPRGVGKTSIARILAHEINELPYTDESMHLDIIEIDAASNRRIDEIRDLREKVHIAPTSAKYKVYIIDEVHMLTREAFNALLKTLEEPPAHVVFILATTELHKLPETIISRTQRFTFKAISEQETIDHLRTIAKSEEITIDDEALRLLASHGRGSFRDSISLLDQVGHSGKKLTVSDVERLIGIAANTHIVQLLDRTMNGTPADIVNAIDRLTADGVSPAQAAKQLAAELRKDIIAGSISDTKTTLLSNLLAVPASPEPAGALEVALFSAHLKQLPQQRAAQPAHATSPVVKQAATPEPEPEPEKVSVAHDALAPVEIEQKISGEIADWWQDVLTHIKSVNNTLYGVLRMAEPREDNDMLHLSFGFGFHKKKASDPTTQAKIHEAIAQVTGKSYTINAVHDKNMTKNQQHAVTTAPTQTENVSRMPDEPTPTEDISSITSIFGGGEVLES